MSTLSLNIFTPPEWTAEAVCASTDPALFYPHGTGSGTATAKGICSSCPVVDQCLQWALDYESGHIPGADIYESHGIFGGLTADERRVLLDHKAAA